MALSAQDKIMYVANKLGLSTLKDMQGSTGAVYDVDSELSGTIFSQAARHENPTVTNINENQFEVNEALLVETVGFYVLDNSDITRNFQAIYGSNAVIVFDLVIGNKRVCKDTPIFGSGSPFTFANTANITTAAGEGQAQVFFPRHQVFMEGAGILIPPQVQWYVEYRIFDMVTGATIVPGSDTSIGCYLFGTRVLLNFNTTI